MTKQWPKRYAKLQAKIALSKLPDRVRPYYHAEYKIALYSDQMDRDGDFAGLVCNECNHWRQYGHKEGCKVIRLEPDYRWRPHVSCKRYHRRFHIA